MSMFNFLSVCTGAEDNATIESNQRQLRNDEEVTELQSELQEEQKRSEDLTATNDALTVQIQSLKDQLALYDNNATVAPSNDNPPQPESQQQVKQLQRDLEAMKQSLDTETEARQKVQSDLQKELDAKQRAHDASIESHKSQLEQTKQELAALQTKYSDLEKRRDQLMAKLKDEDGSQYLEMLEEYQTQFKQKDAIVAQRDETIIQLKSKMRESETKQQNDRYASKEEISKLQEQQNELQTKLEKETERASGVQQLLETEAKENQSLRDKQSKLESQLAKETRRADALQSQLESQLAKIQSLQSSEAQKGTVAFAEAVLDDGEEDQDDEYATEDADDEKGAFNELKYRTTGPTVIGVDAETFDAAAYAVKVNQAIDTLRNNPKERIREAVKILMECNAEQRAAIAKEKSDVTLESKFSLYSSNKKVLKLLGQMIKSQSECDAEWIHKAINSKNDSVVIEILFTRTNAQIEAFTQQYARLYTKELAKDIEAAFVKKDEAFVTMCATLIALEKRTELSRGQVNKKWAKNDAKLLKEWLIDLNNSDKAWDALYDLVVNRSWNHLDQVERAFNHETKVALTYQLKKANPNKCIARKAVMAVLEAAHSMHELFASYLQQALKKKKDDALQRVLLSRSEIDLADIDCAFTNNEQFGDSKTTRVWIENSTQSSLYRFILLSLLGLHDHDTERMESIRDRVLVRAPTKINVVTPKMYKGALVKYNPSIIAANSFDVARDANDIATWIKTCDAKVLKEKLADLLPARNAKQRGEILAEYPKVMDDLTKVMKKGQVLTLCDGFLKPSIAAYDAAIIEKCLNENNVTTIGDILCTKNNKEIKAMISAYKATHYKAADLVKKVADLCEENKSGSVRIILDSLLRCKRSEKKKEKVDTKAVASDVEFLINTKKFKAAEKERFVQIFCANNWKYIRAINRQFGMKSSMNLEKLIKDKLGSGDGPGYFTSILLKYSCDPTEYFAQKLFELGAKFDKNKPEIGRIFLTRSETDLNGIRARFVKTPYGKQLDAWVEDKGKESRFGLFLKKMLTSIDDHNDTFDEEEEWSEDAKETEQKEDGAVAESNDTAEEPNPDTVVVENTDAVADSNDTAEEPDNAVAETTDDTEPKQEDVSSTD